jgi:hypothetical protein
MFQSTMQGVAEVRPARCNDQDRDAVGDVADRVPYAHGNPTMVVTEAHCQISLDPVEMSATIPAERLSTRRWARPIAEDNAHAAT